MRSEGKSKERKMVLDVRRGEVEKWKTCAKVSDGSE
jgi:hypothetical protein